MNEKSIWRPSTLPVRSASAQVRGRIVARQLLAVLLERDGGRSGSRARLDRECPLAGDIDLRGLTGSRSRRARDRSQRGYDRRRSLRARELRHNEPPCERAIVTSKRGPGTQEDEI